MDVELSFDERLKGRFRLSAALLVITLAAEIVGGILTNSLALLSDALHVLADITSLLLGWGALYLASKPASDTKTFGWHRAEVMAGLVNGLALLLLSLLILYGTVQRVIAPQEVKAVGMSLIGGLGLAANIVVVLIMRPDAHKDLNIRGVYLHALSDTLSSVGVLLGGVGILLTEWYVLDPIVGIGITAAIFIGSTRLIRESTHILLEGVPRHIDVNDVADSLLAVKGVSGVHDLHIWGLCSTIHSLSAHISIHEGSRSRIRNIQNDVEKKLKDSFNIFHTTLQMDCPSCKESKITFPSGHDAH